jgi:hypothetical protein
VPLGCEFGAPPSIVGSAIGRSANSLLNSPRPSSPLTFVRPLGCVGASEEAACKFGVYSVKEEAMHMHLGGPVVSKRAQHGTHVHTHARAQLKVDTQALGGVSCDGAIVRTASRLLRDQ